MSTPGRNELVPEFLANIRDVHIEQVGKGVVVLVEEVLVKHSTGHEFATMQGEVFHQRILASSQDDFLSGARYFPGDSINYNIADLQQGIRLVGAAAN